MGKYLVFDLETTIIKKYKRTSNPWADENYVVARGWKKQGDPQNSWEYYPAYDRTTTLKISPDVTMLVGFNIKFDLLWEMAQGNSKHLYEFYKRGGRIWDCQYVEYLLSGQQEKYQMCSLDDIVEMYGGRKKIDLVKQMWEQGINTDKIPEDLLIDYLVGTPEEKRSSGDIGNTELVFLGQAAKAKKLGMTKMILDRMDGLLATTDMEWRGLQIDVAEAGRRLKVLNAKLEEADKELQQYVPNDIEFEFNWGSGAHKSCIIFGGTIKYQLQRPYVDPETGQLARKKATEDWPLVNGVPMHPDVFATSAAVQDTYLSGKRKGEGKTKKVDVPGEIKVKYQDYFYTFPGYTKPNPEWQNKTIDGKGNPLYGTGAEVIEELALRDIPFLKVLGQKQSLDKEIGTYYAKYDTKKKMWVGMLTCVQKEDRMLHHALNHTLTTTTRLSSSNPNLQNLPRGDKSEVKKMFRSRWRDGKMLEADYSQLEVVVQGVLSKDPQLCADLRNRIDFHCKRVSAKFNCTYEEALKWCKDEGFEDYPLWKIRRTGVKEFSFQRAYGAGAPAIAAATGLALEDVKTMIEVEDKLYPGILKFNAAVEAEVYKSSVPFQACGEDGVWRTYRRGYYQVPTGTRYSFRTWDAPAFLKKRGIVDSYSPPELKNYPVQGTGGEFVQCILGKLFRHLVSVDFYDDQVYLVNTVHDCVWADCANRAIADVYAPELKRIMESIPEHYNEVHGMDIDVPFPVEVEIGDNMYEMKHWHPEHA